LLVAWAIMSVPAYALIERKIERSFPVGPRPALMIISPDGPVNVRTVPGAREITVSIVQTVDTADPAEAGRRFAELDLTIGEAGADRVEIVSRFRRGHSWAWQVARPVALTYDVSMPERCDVDIRAGGGAITLGAVKGRVNLSTESGAIHAGEIDGTFAARSESGTVSLAACTGDIEVSTEVAGITIGRAAGKTVLASRGGFIEVQRVSGRIVVRGDGSDAVLGFVSPIREAADIVLSGGTLTLRLDNNAASTLDLRSSVFGRVNLRGELPMHVGAGGVGTSRLQADVNGGGPRLVAHARGGSVLVRALEPVPIIE
jgi:hypothetical protein